MANEHLAGQPLEGQHRAIRVVAPTMAIVAADAAISAASFNMVEARSWGDPDASAKAHAHTAKALRHVRKARKELRKAAAAQGVGQIGILLNMNFGDAIADAFQEANNREANNDADAPLCPDCGEPMTPVDC